MWTLECDGDSLAHKKVWLRPGKTYLFGRTKLNTRHDAGFRIDHKSVSRQHLTLSVSPVHPGSSSSVNTRSQITFRDEGTKFKTELDGLKIQNESRTLTKTEHAFRLGNSDQTFRLKWQPIVFTCSFSSKEMRAGNDPLAPYRSRLEELDIKVIISYLIRATTHVIAGKRNTAKGLQALINGKFIVADSFIDALVYAATPSNLDEAESLSPLEENFEQHWPNALEHLPARSKEPSERPVQDYAPNPLRNAVFEGYTFIFCDQAQYEALQEPLANGGGKVFEFKLVAGQTRAEEIVKFVKNAASKKNSRAHENSSDGSGFVVVKFRGSNGYEEWAADLDRQVAQALDLRLVEQSEFLDAILSNDASVLRRPLLPSEEDYTPTGSRDHNSQMIPRRTETEPQSSEPRRSRARPKIVSRFKGYDEDDDDTSISTDIPSALMPSQSNGMHLDDGADTRDHSNASRKRPVQDSDPEDDEEEDLVDKLLPAATALKRRKLEAEANGIEVDSFEELRPDSKPPKPRKEVKIKDLVRERRQAEEETARMDKEVLKETLEGMTVEEMKKLAVVEEMEVPERGRPAELGTNFGGSRWQDNWNGRKNFKKFRRRGDNAQSVRRGPSVIVPLEAVKTKDFGVSEARWRIGSEPPERSNSRPRHRSQSQSQRTQKSSAATQSHTATIPMELVENGSDGPELIDLDAPRMTRHQEHTQQSDQVSSGRSQPNIVNGKRPAPEPPRGPPRVKKRKKFAAAKDSDEDD